ncbi:desulfoferrodoxin family protein [Methylomonas sp. SURF-1]|uniref:Desulfoferrodoxin family protein n=1 Tax=Methylomonas aurea TaxID=2952224 RepID=A0ABT1UI48_9GAMM|nr:desulfoferrodoxin family protein [Methylomonas sp. SURF-1]MCQ8181101.1 desulfoferrodoxin family protein [Methylomonas sp. SURF-1]
MERRDFIKFGAAGAVAGLALPHAGAAAAGSVPTPLGDLFYTKDAQGRWAGKAATHLPVVEVSKDGGKTTVKVTTPHEMKGYEHYIVKHVLLDKDYKFLAEHLFDPAKEAVPVSTFTLEGYSGNLYALSLCNKHDLWVSTVEVA